jgi:hypothetical protein
MSTHEFEKKELEENFEKLRLTLQVSQCPPTSLAGVRIATASCSLADIYLTLAVYWNMETKKTWFSLHRAVGKV